MLHNATVVRNAGWLIAQSVITGPVAILVTAFVARYLGTVRYGALMLLLSYNAIFLVVSSLGLRSYGVREMAARRSEVLAIMGEMVILRTVLAAAASLVAASLFAMIEPSAGMTSVLMLAVMLFLNSLALCFIDGLYGVEQFKSVAMVMGLSAAAVQAGCIAAVLVDGGLDGVTLAYVGGALTILAASAWGFVRRVGMPTHAALDGRHLLHLRRSWTFFLQNVVTAIQQRADVVVVNGVIGAHGAGLYGASMTLVQKIDLVHDGLSTAMFPRLAQLHAQDTAHARELVRSTVRMALVASLPLAIGLCEISPDVVRLVFGPRFDEAGTVLAVMALGIPLRFLYGILFNVHTAMGRQRLVLVASASATALTTALMALGAWSWGAPGAAAAGVAGLCVLCVVLCAAYMTRHGVLVTLRDMIRLALSNAGMTAVLLALHDSNLVVRIAVPAVVYAVLVLACGLVPLAPVRAFLWRSKPLAR